MHLRRGRLWLPVEPTLWLESWSAQSRPLAPGRGEALGFLSITGGQWFNQPCLCNEATMKTQRAGLVELLGWPAREGRGHGNAAVFSHVLLHECLPPGCSWLTHCCKKPASRWVKCLSELCEPLLQINWTQGVLTSTSESALPAPGMCGLSCSFLRALVGTSGL